MGKVLFGVIAVFASFMMVDSLTCNKCQFGLFGLCLFPTSQTCQTNTSVCSNTKTTFASLPSFGGFLFGGCLRNSSSCSSSNTLTLVANYTYTISVTCCSTNNCNTVSAAPTTRMTLGAAVSAAALASLLGRML